jgi:hypothetical protein
LNNRIASASNVSDDHVTQQQYMHGSETISIVLTPVREFMSKSKNTRKNAADKGNVYFHSDSGHCFMHGCSRDAGENFAMHTPEVVTRKGMLPNQHHQQTKEHLTLVLRSTHMYNHTAVFLVTLCGYGHSDCPGTPVLIRRTRKRWRSTKN